MLALEPLLLKLSGIPREPGCAYSVSGFTYYITIIVTKMEHLHIVGEAKDVNEVVVKNFAKFLEV